MNFQLSKFSTSGVVEGLHLQQYQVIGFSFLTAGIKLDIGFRCPCIKVPLIVRLTHMTYLSCMEGDK